MTSAAPAKKPYRKAPPEHQELRLEVPGPQLEQEVSKAGTLTLAGRGRPLRLGVRLTSPTRGASGPQRWGESMVLLVGLCRLTGAAMGARPHVWGPQSLGGLAEMTPHMQYGSSCEKQPTRRTALTCWRPGLWASQRRAVQPTAPLGALGRWHSSLFHQTCCSSLSPEVRSSSSFVLFGPHLLVRSYPPSLGLLTGGEWRRGGFVLARCRVPTVLQGAERSSGTRDCQHMLSIRHAAATLVRFRAQVPGLPTAAQRTVNERARCCARCHPRGLPLVLEMRIPRLGAADITGV